MYSKLIFTLKQTLKIPSDVIFPSKLPFVLQAFSNDASTCNCPAGACGMPSSDQSHQYMNCTKDICYFKYMH